MNTPAMPRRKPGRPRQYSERRYPTTVYLSDSQRQRFETLGHGNLTQGVVTALTNNELWLDHVGDPANPAAPVAKKVAVDDDPSRED